EAHRAVWHGFVGVADVGSGAHRAELPVAAGPVRASQPRIREAHEGAEHDQVEGQEPDQENKFAVTLLDLGHARNPSQPIRECLSSLMMSSRTSMGSASGGNSIIRLPSGSMTHMCARTASAASCPLRSAARN